MQTAGRTPFVGQVPDLPRLKPASRRISHGQVGNLPHGRKGGALLAVLWMAAALAAIAMSVAVTIRTETEHVSNASDGLRAQFLATGSVERAIQWMTWGGLPRGPQGPYWDLTMSRLYMNYRSGDAVVELLPEAAKLNINQAPPEDLIRVVAAVSGDAALAQQIAAAIVDWRQGPTSAGASPLDSYYFGLNTPGGPTFQARHASFEEIEELLFVRGMTPELFHGNYISDAQGRLYARGGLRDCLSVWGSAGPFDPNSASPALLEAMGVNPQQIDQLMRQRAVQPLRPEDLVRMGIANPRVAVGGNLPYMWTLRATARLRRADGAPSDVTRSASAVVKRMDQPRYAAAPVHVLRFHEDAWSEFAVRPAATPGVMQ